MPSMKDLSHADLCALWRLSDLARDMGVSIACAGNWKARDFVPPWYWSRFIDMAEARHGVVITYRQMAKMTEYRRTPSAAANKEKAA